VRRAVGLKLIAGLAAAGLVLSACSSGSSSSGTTSAAATTAASSAQSAASSAATGASGSAGAAAEPSLTGDPSSVKVGLAYDIGGRGDQSFNDLAAARSLKD